MGGKKVTMRAIKRKSGPTHPNSRRALQLARVDQRIERLRAAKSDRKKLVGSKVNQHLTLVFLLPPDLNYIPDKSYLHSFLQTSYLDRHSEQLKELLAERRADRPPSLKLVELQNTIAKEKLEYDTGFEIPDLMNEANVRLMREWNGDSQALGMFRFVRVSGRDQ
jgi:translation machinery-associated protein 16